MKSLNFFSFYLGLVLQLGNFVSAIENSDSYFYILANAMLPIEYGRMMANFISSL